VNEERLTPEVEREREKITTCEEQTGSHLSSESFREQSIWYIASRTLKRYVVEAADETLPGSTPPGCKPLSRTLPWLEGQLEAAGANRAPAAPRLKSTE
jgi:hypothetical protein